MPFYCVYVQDTELLLEQLSKDQEAVGQVQAIVEHEESIMKREAQIVEDYADVRLFVFVNPTIFCYIYLLVSLHIYCSFVKAFSLILLFCLCQIS